MKMHKVGHATRLLVAIALWPAMAGAVGFRLPNQDPEAIARGNAFTATADNPSAIYYNPAGITQLDGQNIRAGVYFVSAGVDYTSPSGATASPSSEFTPVPQLYYAFTLKDSPLSFGLGVYAPYGLSLDWGQNQPLSTLAEKGSLQYLCFNPVIAYKVLPTLSLAVGPTINYSSASFQRGIGILPGDFFKVSGDGMGYGFNAGLLWQPHEKWSFGLSYRYSTTVDYHGTSETSPSPPYPPSNAASAVINFPQFVMGGISFRPNDKWNIEIDIDWADWNQVKGIQFYGTALGSPVLPLNYKSSFMYEIGVTRQLGKGYYLSLGFFFSENSSPDANFNPIVPDSDLYLGSIGVGYKGKHWGWDVGYQCGFNPGRDVTGDITYPQANGNYKFLNNAFNIAATYKF
jgi:long-chain fatty acid transport protein